jgi:hypothetical protein
MKMANAVSKQKRKAALCILVQLLLDDDEQEKKRRGPDRQWIRRRYAKGAYENICKELAAEDTSSFTIFTRMTYKCFQTLVDVVSSKIVKKSIKMRGAIPVAERVALTLRFLVTGASFRSLEYQFCISRRAISYIVFEVCEAIYSESSGLSLTFPKSEDEWRQIEEQFSTKWNFPHCVGALDGKHVVMLACGSGSFYYNYKGTNSIVLMVLGTVQYLLKGRAGGKQGRARTFFSRLKGRAFTFLCNN